MKDQILFTPIKRYSQGNNQGPKVRFEPNLKGPLPNLLKIEPVKETMTMASQKQAPQKLFGSLWHEGELCILVADTNTGKSILAVQVGDNISSSCYQPLLNCDALKQAVLYFDFELSDKQFQMRYSCKSEGSEWAMYEFSDQFYRISINPDFAEVMDFETLLMAEIELAVEETGAKILIIDNLTFLKSQSVDTAKEALPLMQKLKSLKSRKGLSMLVLAHTPKRNYFNPISKNDIAGSKHLANFADSIFAIGESSQDKSVRYIKQLKARETEIEFDSDNVIECVIKKQESRLFFDIIGFGKEKDHLRQSDPDELETKILTSRAENPNLSLRDLANLTGTNHMKVKRILDRNNVGNDKEL